MAAFCPGGVLSGGILSVGILSSGILSGHRQVRVSTEWSEIKQ